MANFFDQFDEQQSAPQQLSSNFFDQFDEQAQQSPEAQPQERSLAQDALLGVSEAGGAIAQAAVDTANIAPMVADVFSNAAAWAANKLGLGDGTYYPSPRLSLPEGVGPQTQEGQIAADVLPFLVNPASRAPAVVGNLAERGANLAARLGAESAVGSAAQNSGNQNIEQAATGTLQDLGINAGIGGAVRGVGNAIGAGYRATRGTIAPETQTLLNQADQAKVPVMTSDVIEPKTKLGRGLQDYSEGVIMGTGTMRAAQQDARTQLIQNYGERFGDYDPAVIVNSAKEGIAREKAAAQQGLNRISSSMVGKPIDTSGTIRAIDGAITQLGRLKSASDTQTIEALQTYKRAIQETSGGSDAFEMLDKLRTQFRIDVKGDRAVLPSGSQSITDRVYNAFTNSLNKSIAKEVGAKEASAWRKGKADYARMATDATQTRLKNVLQKGELTPETVNTIVYGQYGSDIARLYGKLDDTGKDMLRAAYISKIADKANGSPQRMMTELDKLSKQANGQVFKTVFSGKHRKELEGLIAVLDKTSRASKSNIVTQTGMTLAAPIRVVGNLSTGGAMLAGEAGIGILSRIYESPGMRNMLLRLAGTPKGSLRHEALINEASQQLGNLMKGGREQ